MTEPEIAALVFACVFGSAMLGLFTHGALPAHHLTPEAKDVVKLGTGLIATLAALVLSLLISSAKTSFDRMDEEIVENAARVVSLDRMLADYGPETKEVRDHLKHAYAAWLHQLFPDKEHHAGKVDTPESVVRMEGIRAKLWELTPVNDAQRWLRSQAVDIANQMSATRWLLLMQKDVAIPVPLLVILVCWLTLIFSTFGLLAPRNTTVIVVLLVCALSATGAILLILEMNSPFSGIMKISSAPMRDALADLGK
jgi:hypothetical protein